MYLKAIKNHFPHRQTSGFKSPSGAKPLCGNFH
nr:MAG TPA: hypothetical protein [Bacteriophage sp.]